MTDPHTPRLSVDIVSDVMCPWCIIGWLKFQKVMAHFAGRLDFRVQWHPFELNPDMPAEGEDAASHVMRKYGISAEQSGATGVQTALKLALFAAHFTDNRDVSDHAVLADVAASVGLDRARAAAILASGEFGEMVRTEEAYWADQNITGVPAFILGGRMLIPGAQDPEVFIRVIENKVLAAAA